MNAAHRTPALPTKSSQARRARRISPLELLLRAGVPPRHTSFVEGGCSRPGRELFAGMRRNVIGAEEGACGWI
jgi:hypothetical protein